jgi:CheY-like chemotaxis protein
LLIDILARMRKPIVLVVDDEDTFLEITTLKLIAAGFETQAARGAEEAMVKAESVKPDFVLSDIYMAPGANGWELALRLHRNPKTHGIKLALFTSLREPWLDMSDEVRQNIKKELGNIVVWSKADDMEQIGERVKSLLA